MGISVSMQFGKPGTVGGGRSSGGSQPILLGTDSSGNTNQTKFQLSDGLQNYSSIFALVEFNWASASNVNYEITSPIPIPIFASFTDYPFTVMRQVGGGTSNYEVLLRLQYVDSNHISITKTHTTYSFKTVRIYGIR